MLLTQFAESLSKRLRPELLRERGLLCAAYGVRDDAMCEIGLRILITMYRFPKFHVKCILEKQLSRLVISGIMMMV